MDTPPKQSPLLPIQQTLCPSLHLKPALGGDWLLPVDYGTGCDDYAALHTAGMIDRSWVSVLRLTGADRHAFLQGMVTNDVGSLADGHSCPAALLDTTGHLLAPLRVYNTGDALLLETDPRTLPRLAATLEMYLIMEDVTIADVSGDWAVVALRGPEALNALATLNLNGECFLVPADENISGADLWLPVTQAVSAWERLFHAGVVPVGEAAADAARIEAGTPLWGAELSEATLLPEADVPDWISYTKGCYVGQEIIARLHARGHANRLLRGILLAMDAPVPRPGETVHLPDDGPDAGREIGRITSAASSPLFGGRALALAYVRRKYADHAVPVAVQIAQPGGLTFAFAGRVLTRPFTDPD